MARSITQRRGHTVSQRASQPGPADFSDAGQGPGGNIRPEKEGDHESHNRRVEFDNAGKPR